MYFWNHCYHYFVLHSGFLLGYRSERKVEFFWNPALFWQHVSTYFQNLVILNLSSLQSGDFWPYFLKKIFYELHWVFFVCKMLNLHSKGSSFGLSLAFPFCLPCYGFGHRSFIWFLWCSHFHPLKKKQINNTSKKNCHWRKLMLNHKYTNKTILHL